jgi:hypothetical protein
MEVTREETNQQHTYHTKTKLQPKLPIITPRESKARPPLGRRLDGSGQPHTAARDGARRPQSAGSWSSRRGSSVVKLMVVVGCAAAGRNRLFRQQVQRRER